MPPGAGKEQITLKRKSMKTAAFLLACVFSLGNVAYGEELVLSEGLTVIEEAAFAGDTSISSVVLPEGIQEIGPRAFAESSVTEINIPDGIERIAADAFEGAVYPLLIRANPDSYGVWYALANEVDFRADTVCRALVIGQGDYPNEYQLNGPPKDAAAMEAMLSADFQVVREGDLTADGILSAIAQTFAGAADSDISLFYYAGHGKESSDPEKNGALLGIDLEVVTPVQLRAALDGVKGRKIVIIDACYSGSYIGRGGEAPESPAVSQIRAFQPLGDVNAANLAAQQYFVFTASAGDELSWESKRGGLFTEAFIESRNAADDNADGVITIAECYTYTADRVRTLAAAGKLVQNVQVYPENCTWFGLFR